MAEPELTIPSEEDQDLPRTLRRAKAQQRRENLEREQAEAKREPVVREERTSSEFRQPLSSSFRAPEASNHDRYDDDDAEDEVTITRIRVPFFHLMGFFIKAALAAVPALILLGAILYGVSLLLQRFLPWLQPQLFILFP